MLGTAGDTSIDTRVASVTVNVVSPVTPPLLADTVVLPRLAVVARPFEPAALLTVATAPSDDAQAYWYWSGPYQKSTQTLEADRLKDNAVIMQRCINQEQRMQSTGGLAGLAEVGSTGVDAERLCAEKNNLYKRDGNWHSRKD